MQCKYCNYEEDLDTSGICGKCKLTITTTQGNGKLYINNKLRCDIKPIIYPLINLTK